MDSSGWESLESVVTSLIPTEKDTWDSMTEADRRAIRELILQDPRPAYHSDSSRAYHIIYKDKDIGFSINGAEATISSIKDSH